MPRLAGSYDLTDDGRLDMQIASGIGQGIGRFIERRREAKEADRLRAEEEKRQETDALIVRTLHQSQLNDWDGKHTLQALMQIPGYINSTFAKQQALRAMQPPQDIYGKVPGEYRYLNEEERRNAALRKTGQGSSSGGKRVIDFWDKDGNKHKKLVTDDNFNDVIQSIIESGGRLEEDSLTKELSYWQTSLQKTLDPLGDVLPGQEETAALANERISILRNMIRGKSLPAEQPPEQPQLQGDMTEQQADTRQPVAPQQAPQQRITEQQLQEFLSQENLTPPDAIDAVAEFVNSTMGDRPIEEQKEAIIRIMEQRFPEYADKTTSEVRGDKSEEWWHKHTKGLEKVGKGQEHSNASRVRKAIQKDADKMRSKALAELKNELETAIGKADSSEWERIQSDYEAKAKAINDRINEQVKAAHAEVQAFLDSREQEKQERYLSVAKTVILNAKRRIYASGRKPTKEDIDLIRRTLLANNLSKEQADALLKQEFQSFFERNN